MSAIPHSRTRSILVTGGAGFIGSNFVDLLIQSGHRVVVLDALTYAGHRENLVAAGSRIQFIEGNICDRKLLADLFSRYEFDAVVNFAAESHVDRSISNPAAFVETNVMGVFTLLDASTRSFEKRSSAARAAFRFVQISTDEVYGSLGDQGYFTENSPHRPNSPYSASKASGDHFARAWYHTYGLPVVTTNCSNNYGPKQFPEKLIPHMIICALGGRSLPVYGSGQNIRDWIHVADHCHGVMLALENGKPGESYCLGGRSEKRNLDVVKAICGELDRVCPREDKKSYSEQITFVEDRKGHDWRYAIDDSKAERELGFKRRYSDFEHGLKQTVSWYLENQQWLKSVQDVTMKGLKT